MMNEEQIFLANAYLDGELTAEERRIAEADPAVMAEVDELRALQGLVRDVPPPSDAVREAAVTAAMAEFRPAVAPRPAPVTPPPPVVPFRRRPAFGRILAVAATFAGIGLLGLVIVNLPSGDDDDDAADEPAAVEVATDDGDDAAGGDAAEEPAEEPAAEAAVDDREFAESEAAEELEAADAEADLADDGADAGAEPAAEEPAMEEPADEAADDDGGEVDAAETRTSLAPSAGLSIDMPLRTGEEFSLFALDVFLANQAGEAPPTPNTACPDPNILSRSFLEFDGVPAEVLVQIDVEAGLAVALHPETCDVLLEAPLEP